MPNFTGTVQLSCTGGTASSATFRASDHGLRTVTVTPPAAGTDTLTAVALGTSVTGSLTLNVLAAPTTGGTGPNGNQTRG